MNKLFVLLVALTFLSGCGDDDVSTDGGSDPVDGSVADLSTTDAPVDSSNGRDKAIGDLTLAEAEAECVAVAAAFGSGEKDCGDGITIRPQTDSECATTLEAATCTSTLAELDACIAALDGDPCGLFTKAECAFFAQCVTASGN